MQHNSDHDAPQAAKQNFEVFGKLLRDRRVSHGAFRLWHALRDYMNNSSTCFPGQRTLADDIGCNVHSIKGWRAELVKTGWLKFVPGWRGGFFYTLLDGRGNPLRLMRKLASVKKPTDAETGLSTDAEIHTSTDAETGIISKPIEDKPREDKKIHVSADADSFPFSVLEVSEYGEKQSLDPEAIDALIQQMNKYTFRWNLKKTWQQSVTDYCKKWKSNHAKKK